MSITDMASLMAAHNDYAPTAAEVTAWNTVTKFSSERLIDTKAGLFGGADLTKFNEDCAALTACNVDDYASFSGWAVGVNWTPTSDNANSYIGVAFNGLKTYVEALYLAETEVKVYSFELKTPASDSSPKATESDLVLASDAFAAWSFKAVTGIRAVQNTFYF